MKPRTDDHELETPRDEDHAHAAYEPEHPRRNLAARMGHWSACHWKTATFGWLAFVVVAFLVGNLVGTEQIDRASAGPGESGRADKILDEGFTQPAGESVLLQSNDLTVDKPAFRAALADTLGTLEGNPDVTKIRSPLDPANEGQISEDRGAALVEFQVTGDPDKAVDKIDPIVADVADVAKAPPGLFIGEFGDASADKELNQAFSDDLKKAGLFSLPITLLILVIAFGALVAAGIPLLLALTAVLATMGLVALPSQVVPMDESVSAIILLIGLAVGVDYSMFYLKREREERAAGRTERAALEAAAATSGRSVLISGLTVLVAMAGMFLTGDKGFASFGVATMTVVAVAMLGSLTVLPALLSRLGDKVDRLRVPFVSRLRRDDGEGRIWGAIINRVLRRPVVSVVVAGGFLLLVAAPAVQLRTAVPDPGTFPDSLSVIKTYDRMQAAFPGTEIPATVVVKAADVTSPEVAGAIAALEDQAVASGKLHQPVTVDVNAAGTVASVDIPVDGDGSDSASEASLATLRDTVVPDTVGALPGAETAVTGYTAQSVDYNTQMKSVLPLVFGFVLVFAFLLMLVAFRSLVIAFKAIVLNLLSVGAAYGVLVLVFQHGWGKEVLGFQSTAGIDPFLPILLFVILFGLSMDYHVFILSRIRETYDRGASTERAIVHGIKSTAGVVTSAAIVMVAVFGVFATLSMMIFKQFGVGLAVAILVDATIVRAVLLPATMKLLGEANWYLPRWLEWLPHLEHGSVLEPVGSSGPDGTVDAGKPDGAGEPDGAGVVPRPRETQDIPEGTVPGPDGDSR
ncbi:MAG: MMPL family transporter [Actinomycetes bacterium]